MTAGFEMLSYALAWSLPHASEFWILALMSAFMVFSALVTFSYAHKDHKDHLRSLMDTPEFNRATNAP